MKAITILAVAMVALLVMWPAAAQKEQLSGMISRKNQTAGQLYESMKATDDILAAHQNKTALTQEDLKNIKKDTARAASSMPDWNKRVSDLDNDYQSLYQSSLRSQLSPQDSADVNANIKDFHKNIASLKQRLSSIAGRIESLSAKAI
jgi:chromosome segregation ATPase